MLIYNKANKQVIEGTKIGETKYTIKVETLSGIATITLRKSEILIKPEILGNPADSKLIIDSLNRIKELTEEIDEIENQLESLMMTVN